METIGGIPNPVDAPTEHGVILGRSDEFIESALVAGRYIQASLPIVGRAEELHTLTEFMREPASKRVVIVSGRAGIGKTTLLAALAETYAQHAAQRVVRFVLDAPSSASTQPLRLPRGPCVIVVDDAHRRACTAMLLHAAKDRPDVAFVLTTRPGGLSRLVAQTVPMGLRRDELLVLPELEPLSRPDAEQAALAALDEDFVVYVEPLAAVGAGHPQLISIGGRLLREATLHPVALEQAHEFGARVLARAYEAVIIRTSSTPDQKLVGGVFGQVTDTLGLVAALAPVRTSDERFLQGAGELLGCRRRDVVSALRALESAGILERSQSGVRVVPTALADHAMLRLFTAPLPLSGTLAQRVHNIVQHLGTHALVPLFRNAGEMDGMSVLTNGAERFVDELFAAIRIELENASTLERCRILSALREVCCDQPAGMLSLCRFALHLPLAEDAEPRSRVFFLETSVTNELPRLLQRIASHLNQLPAALDFLWELGRGDVRLQSSHADHPMRILRDFASKQFALPEGFHEAILDAVERWDRASGAYEYQHSPLDVLETFLADSITLVENEDLAERHIQLRRRAVEMLSHASTSKNRRAAVTAVRELGNVLADASTLSEMRFSDAAWRNEEQLEVLRVLSAAARAGVDPLVHFAITDVLRSAMHRTANDAVRVNAELVLAQVPESWERRLYETLTSRPMPQRRAGESELPPSSTLASEMRSGEPRGAESARIVVEEAIERGDDAALFVQRTAEAIDVLASAGKSGSPRILLQVLSLKNPVFAALVCEAIVVAADGPLGPHVAALLHTLRESSPDRAGELIRDIVQAGQATLCASLAQAFPKWVERPRLGDQEALRRLLAHRDGFVRRAALGALRTLAKTAPQDAVALALEVDLSEGSEAVETLFGALDAGKLLTGEVLSVEDMVVFLSKLAKAPNLEGSSTIRFLHFAGKRLPEETAILLIERVERQAHPDSAQLEDFVALPPEGLSSMLARLPESPEWPAILRRIRNLARVRTHQIRARAARLFRAASRRYSPVALEILAEWLSAGRAEEFEGMAILLEEAPATVFFTHALLVATLLRNCHALSSELYDSVFQMLLPIAMGKSRGPTTGVHLSDIALRTQAREAAAKLPTRSPERRFYETIVKETESVIAQDNDDDLDDLFDL